MRKLVIIYFMHYLRNVHDTNVCKTDGVCLSVSMINLENRWTGIYEIWYDLLRLEEATLESYCATHVLVVW